MSSVRNNVWLRGGNSSNSRYFTCGTLDRSLKFAKSRFTHKIIIIILNRFFRGKRRANTNTRVLVSQTNLVCGSKCHLDISGTNVPQGAVHSGWPAIQMLPKITNNVIWCQETFTNSQKRWKVLETIFGSGSKHLKGTAVHCGTFVPRFAVHLYRH